MFTSLSRHNLWLDATPEPGSPAPDGAEQAAESETPLEAALRDSKAPDAPTQAAPKAVPKDASPPKGEADEGEVAPEIRKVIQAEVDRVRHDMSHKLKAAETENDRLKAEVAKHATAEQLQVMEQDERERTIQAKEAELSRREARDYCMRAIRTAKLDDGTEDSLGLVEFLTDAGNSDEQTQKNIDMFKSYLERRIDAGVDDRFKKAARKPQKGTSGGGDTDEKAEFAASLVSRPTKDGLTELQAANKAYGINT